jgi:hypothetical protein
MNITDELWSLLPAVYRRRDAETPQDGALRALVGILGEQGQIVAEDIAALYDDWFIETCDPWVVSYIGDLLGVRMLHQVGPATQLPRAYVANTLAYRRRKGTAAVVEQLTRDVTGWPSHVIEGFTVVGTTQHLDHLRPRRRHAVSLHDAAALERVTTTFDPSNRTVDVRPPPVSVSNIPDIGVAVWRLPPLRVERVTARAVSDPPDGRYRFDPVGLDAPLVNPPQPESTITSLATEQHVPGILGRRALFDELEGLRATTVDEPVYFGADPVIRVFADTGSGLTEIPPAELTSADLSDPPPSVSTGWRRPAAPVTATIDPVLGRLAFRAGLLPASVEVSYTYTAPGLVGAGPYDRSDATTEDVLDRATWWRAVGPHVPAGPGVVATLAEAVADWNATPGGTVGVIAVLDSRTYEGDVDLAVPAGSELLVAAANWPQVLTPDPEILPSPTQMALAVTRPHIFGSVTVTGGGPPDAQTPRGRLLLDGLLVEGDVGVTAGDLGELQVLHCTVVPGLGSLTVAADSDLAVTVDGSVLGPATVAGPDPVLSVRESIVDGPLDATDVDVTLEQVTVLGDLTARSLDVSDCVVTGTALAARRQAGCVRFSVLGGGSQTPRRYRCQPDLALDPPVGPVDPVAVRARVRPVFTSTRFGNPHFGHLADRCAVELTEGSSTQSDMGAFASLYRSQREANVRVALDEYLRLGLVAGLIHAS